MLNPSMICRKVVAAGMGRDDMVALVFVWLLRLRFRSTAESERTHKI